MLMSIDCKETERKFAWVVGFGWHVGRKGRGWANAPICWGEGSTRQQQGHASHVCWPFSQQCPAAPCWSSPGYMGHITGITSELWMANALGPPQFRSKPPPHATLQLEAPASLGSPWELGSRGGQSGRAGQSGQEQSRGRAACRQVPAVM